MKNVEDYIRSIYDFPKEGINFRDITTLLKDAEGLHLAIDKIVESLKDVDFDYVIAPEARGFIFGMPVAYIMKKGFVPIRKKGKLPGETVSITYELEYGNAQIEIHKDAFLPNANVVIVDDLMATGGTTKAMVDLIKKLGGNVVKVVCLMELAGLCGKEKIKDIPFESIITYPNA